MQPGPTDARQHRYVFRGFDQSVARVLGTDARLLYGMAIPILMIVGLIMVLALSPAGWLVALIVLFEIAALALVITGLLEMMSDDQDDGST
jgi:uncharacterized membrane protein